MHDTSNEGVILMQFEQCIMVFDYYTKRKP